MTSSLHDISEIPEPVLVTGASGFLGREIAGQLLARGLEVRGLSRTPSGIGGVGETLGDIRDREIVRRAVSGIGTVIHAAGRAHVFGPGANDPEPFREVNERGTAIVCEEATRAGVFHIVYVSTVAVYGRSGSTEESPCEPIDAYGSSKWRGELEARRICSGTDTSLTVLRLATAFGRNDRGNTSRLIGAIRRGRFVWLGKGKNRKSLIHRRDAARACVVAVENVPDSEAIYNVSGEGVAMRRIVEMIGGAAGRKVPRLFVPVAPVRMVLALGDRLAGERGRVARWRRLVEKWIAEDVYPGERFCLETGFEFEVGLREGIEEQLSEPAC